MQDLDSTGESSIADALDRKFAVVDDVATVEALLWLVVFASIALDVYTTWVGLSAGLTEGNPLMSHAIDDFGIAALAAAKLLVVAVALGFRALRPRYAGPILLGLALPWAATVLINAVTLATL